MKWIGVDHLREWYAGQGTDKSGLSALTATIGARPVDPDFAANVLRLPLHLITVVRRMSEEEHLRDGVFDSIPFYSLCRGLFLPLTGMMPEKAAQIFGIQTPPPPQTAERTEMLRGFMERDLGLTYLQKVACLLGDPFEGRPATMRRESLLRLLQSVSMKTRPEMLDRLTLVGDVAILFAESRKDLRGAPPLTASEVLHTLRVMPDLKRTLQFQILRSILARCGKLEAFFLARLILGKAGLRYEGELLSELIAQPWEVQPEQITHAMALTDAFHVVKVLSDEGVEGLRKIELQPLVPVRPALASGSTDEIKNFPVWVERKYDGIRLMLHKDTDRLGTMLCGAYSRNRRDYLELIRGLDATIKMLPARSTIVDGELHGSVIGPEGPRPALVHEVLGSLQGDGAMPVQLRFTAFDLLYLEGADLTGLSLSERRQHLQRLIQPLAGMPTPLPVTLSEGQMAERAEDVKRLYQHFRSQGYEGVVTKDLGAPYRLAARDPAWLKRKPSVTLDLVILAAVLAVTAKENVGLFGSYTIGARLADGSFEDVGDVAGLDKVRDAEIQQRIMSEGLLTGRRVERQSASGVRPGYELAPHLVLTVRFAAIVREPATGRLSLRDPKVVAIRGDKNAHEADTLKAIEDLYLRQQVG